MSNLDKKLNYSNFASSKNKKVDVVFVVNTRFNMLFNDGNIYTSGNEGHFINVQNNINTFVEKFANEYNLDTRFSLIEFRKISDDGFDSTKQHKNNNSNWFTSVDDFKQEVDSLTCGNSISGDISSSFIDALELARRTDWRNDAGKFVIFITNDAFDYDNRYGINDFQLLQRFINDGIIVSSIAWHEVPYEMFPNNTGGVLGYARYNFSDDLLKLVDKVDDAINFDGEWVFLDNFKAVKLKGKIADAKNNDSDDDGLTDSSELGSSTQLYMIPYISMLTNKYSVPLEYYKGKRKITVWKHISDPTELDTDYDGIPDGSIDYDGKAVTRDVSPKDNSFTASFHWQQQDYDGLDGKMVTKNDVNFEVDYRLLLDNNKKYKQDLATLTSLLAGDIYTKTYLNMTGGIGLNNYDRNNDDSSALLKQLGLKDIENIKLDGYSYKVDVDDVSEFNIGHRTITHNGYKKEVVVVIIRGTNDTNAEWSSNFDIGADTSEYYAATGSYHPDWKNKEHHKGFDVASNRIINKIDAYLSRHSLTSGDRTILIGGHSRGAAIANLIGAYYEDNSDFTTFTYTFATPNTTTSKNISKYRTIFNIINTDDMVSFLPLSQWGFRNYGRSKEVSIANDYENKWGSAEKGTWEWLVGVDYDHYGGLGKTINSLGKIAKNREQLYVIDETKDGFHTKLFTGRTSYYLDTSVNSFLNDLIEQKLFKFCKTRKTEMYINGGRLQQNVIVNYSPAYVMQMLANMAIETVPNFEQKVSGKYADAILSFGLASGKLIIGGVEHPHMPITYYFIADQVK